MVPAGPQISSRQRLLPPAIRQAHAPESSYLGLSAGGLHRPLHLTLLLSVRPPFFPPHSTRQESLCLSPSCLLPGPPRALPLLFPDPVSHLLPLPGCRRTIPELCGTDPCLLMAGTLEQYYRTELTVTMEMFCNLCCAMWLLALEIWLV